MSAHLITGREEVAQSSKTTFELKKMTAVFTEEKVVMAECAFFVMRCGTGNLNAADLPVILELFQGAVNGRKADTLN